MKKNNLWVTARPAGLNAGMIVRLSLAIAALVGSIALAFALLGTHYNAHAAGASKKTPASTKTATSTPTPPPLQTGPVSKSWYFAEGRVGGGFNEYLSMDNPTANDCSVAIEYLYTPDGHNPLTKQVKVNIPAHTRAEEGVDGDLGTSSGGFGITDSAILTVDNT
ncbi:MAG TPA: hypothetical protein VKR83_17175, partial [Ktedonobacteraceae bacterium]|nr:hypothetical protein [Ktedonobacteraceae bacterium]